MAEGVRIRHTDPRRAGSVHVVPLLHKPFPPQPPLPVCGACARGAGQQLRHPVKTLHLALDSQGCIIVSREILADLRRVPDMAGYRVDATIAKPPDVQVAPERINMRIDGFSFGKIEVTAGEYVDQRLKAGVDVDTAVNEMASMLLAQLLGQATKGVAVHGHRRKT